MKKSMREIILVLFDHLIRSDVLQYSNCFCFVYLENSASEVSLRAEIIRS